MKKILLIILILIFLGIGYLKIPVYTSGIEDSYFYTKHYNKDELSEDNGILLFGDFLNNIKSLFSNSVLDYKYNCIYDKNECKKYEEYKIENEITKKDEEKYLEEVVGLLKEEINLYSNLRKKDFLKYSEKNELRMGLLFRFEKAKIVYLHYLIDNEKYNFAMGMIKNSLGNNIYMLKNTDSNLVFLVSYEGILSLDIKFIKFLKENNLLTNEYKKGFIEILNLSKLDEKIYKKSFKADFLYLISTIEGFKLKDYFNINNIGENGVEKKLGFDDYILGIQTFFTLNPGETKELFKKAGKYILEGNFDKGSEILDGGFKNYGGKRIVFGKYSYYKSFQKDFSIFLSNIEELKNSLK